ncbi:ubiquinone/menaquinone biosynthesis methyltransferase [Fundidesulfovibrio agrisoli]|uniref:ubiquinone/menaquinone biosynthesis methyltransferase n=1 Tax=Fundidesulfovibrio agrisoli TaxID=2922717 RepID=UPI001FAE4AAE|nr:ubiquinone/menaquinone biosynthesis methyltransferase [Fundidesulfovibrio agrisoli]
MASDHGRSVASMFGRIAGWYDFLNHFLSLGLDILWRRRLVDHIGVSASGSPRVLDLAAGTLDVSLEIARRFPRARIAAADFCLPMLTQGAQKLARRGVASIAPVQADGRALPFPDETFEAATIAFGIRNIRPRSEAYAELLRVLRPGGRLCILEFGSGKQRILGGVYNLYLNRLLPLLGKVFSKDDGAYQYLADTIREFPDAPSLAQEMRASGFASVNWERLAFGIVVIHVGVKQG